MASGEPKTVAVLAVEAVDESAIVGAVGDSEWAADVDM